MYALLPLNVDMIHAVLIDEVMKMNKFTMSRVSVRKWNKVGVLIWCLLMENATTTTALPLPRLNTLTKLNPPFHQLLFLLS